jgi:hypothetical protein
MSRSREGGEGAIGAGAVVAKAEEAGAGGTV